MRDEDIRVMQVSHRSMQGRYYSLSSCSAIFAYRLRTVGSGDPLSLLSALAVSKSEFVSESRGLYVTFSAGTVSV